MGLFNKLKRKPYLHLPPSPPAPGLDLQWLSRAKIPPYWENIRLACLAPGLAARRAFEAYLAEKGLADQLQADFSTGFVTAGEERFPFQILGCRPKFTPDWCWGDEALAGLPPQLFGLADQIQKKGRDWDISYYSSPRVRVSRSLQADELALTAAALAGRSYAVQVVSFRHAAVFLALYNLPPQFCAPQTPKEFLATLQEAFPRFAPGEELTDTVWALLNWNGLPGEKKTDYLVSAFPNSSGRPQPFCLPRASLKNGPGAIETIRSMLPLSVPPQSTGTPEPRMLLNADLLVPGMLLSRDALTARTFQKAGLDAAWLEPLLPQLTSWHMLFSACAGPAAVISWAFDSYLSQKGCRKADLVFNVSRCTASYGQGVTLPVQLLGSVRSGGKAGNVWAWPLADSHICPETALLLANSFRQSAAGLGLEILSAPRFRLAQGEDFACSVAMVASALGGRQYCWRAFNTKQGTFYGALSGLPQELCAPLQIMPLLDIYANVVSAYDLDPQIALKSILLWNGFSYQEEDGEIIFHTSALAENDLLHRISFTDRDKKAAVYKAFFLEKDGPTALGCLRLEFSGATTLPELTLDPLWLENLEIDHSDWNQVLSACLGPADVLKRNAPDSTPKYYTRHYYIPTARPCSEMLPLPRNYYFSFLGILENDTGSWHWAWATQAGLEPSEFMFSLALSQWGTLWGIPKLSILPPRLTSSTAACISMVASSLVSPPCSFCFDKQQATGGTVFSLKRFPPNKQFERHMPPEELAKTAMLVLAKYGNLPTVDPRTLAMGLFSWFGAPFSLEGSDIFHNGVRIRFERNLPNGPYRLVSYGELSSEQLKEWAAAEQAALDKAEAERKARHSSEIDEFDEEDFDEEGFDEEGLDEEGFDEEDLGPDGDKAP